ncbi:MAG: hypothetical protein ABI910_16525 [Gemmatimonadota bacterium]
MLPLWIVSFVVVGALWSVIVPLDVLLKAVGGSWLSPARAKLERALFVLTHPKIPDRWRRR